MTIEDIMEEAGIEIEVESSVSITEAEEDVMSFLESELENSESTTEME